MEITCWLSEKLKISISINATLIDNPIADDFSLWLNKMKLLSAEQIREVDAETIANEGIESWLLMERAATAFVDRFLQLNQVGNVYVFCGTGNNGGDGLAIARLLEERGRQVSVYVIGNLESGSGDFLINYEKVASVVLNRSIDFPVLKGTDVTIDALFGSGLSRPITGIHADLIDYLNEREAISFSVDMPSGLFIDKPIVGNTSIFKADYTISFQLPKLAFLLADSQDFVGQWSLVDIGLHEEAIKTKLVNYTLVEESEVASLIPKRSIFTFKNKVGAAQIVGGSKGKIGASILSAKAAFKVGAGLVYLHLPSCGTEIAQISLMEAMVEEDKGVDVVTDITWNMDRTYALGPGLGTDSATVTALHTFLEKVDHPIVLDADALNILAEYTALIKMVPKESILTPHPGEFRRLVGAWGNDYDKLDHLKNFAKTHQLNVVLKGAYSAICDTKGNVSFNSSGNPLLATAGSGDVLTGVIVSFLSQGLSPLEALRLGVYVHGKAADLFRDRVGKYGLIASDIINLLPEVLHEISG